MKRIARFAGLWYPTSADELSLITGNPELHGNNVNAVLPHAGLFYSGGIIRNYFESLSSSVRSIVIISPSHYYYIEPDVIVTASFTSSSTPFGDAETVPLSIPHAVHSDTALQAEHGVEMFLPFIAARGLKVSYALVSSLSSAEKVYEKAGLFKTEADGETAFIASSDFTHYGPQFNYKPYSCNAEESVVESDSRCAALLAGGRIEKVFADFTKGTICGIAPAMIVSALSSEDGLAGMRGPHTTSNDVSGEKDENFVSYQSVYWRKEC